MISLINSKDFNRYKQNRELKILHKSSLIIIFNDLTKQCFVLKDRYDLFKRNVLYPLNFIPLFVKVFSEYEDKLEKQFNELDNTTSNVRY